MKVREFINPLVRRIFITDAFLVNSGTSSDGSCRSAVVIGAARPPAPLRGSLQPAVEEAAREFLSIAPANRATNQPWIDTKFSFDFSRAGAAACKRLQRRKGLGVARLWRVSARLFELPRQSRSAPSAGPARQSADSAGPSGRPVNVSVWG